MANGAKPFKDFIKPRDYLMVALRERDFEAQLLAIRNLLKRNQAADDQLSQEMKQLESEAEEAAKSAQHHLYQEHLIDLWGESLISSVFQDAAHSMAAVGMLAPFLESFFTALFKHLCTSSEMLGAGANHPRIKAADKRSCDPHYFYDNGRWSKDIAKGFNQLVDIAEVKKHLPKDFVPAFEALIAYRNKMFHQGFEWPEVERAKFSNRIASEGWPTDWFSSSRQNDADWIYYMSSKFIDYLLSAIDEMFHGLGEMIAERKQI